MTTPDDNLVDGGVPPFTYEAVVVEPSARQPGRIVLLQLGNRFLPFGRLDRLSVMGTDTRAGVVIRYTEADRVNVMEETLFRGTRGECRAWIAERFDITTLAP